jgi:DNA topoisomerase VI subunit B
VLLKELIDNALDACETAGTPPEINITLTPQGFTVADNGPGISQALIERSLDYDIRVSDKMYYVSPTRGQLGNALKCLWAAPYAINEGAPGSVEVVSRGLQHRIATTIDRIAQELRLQHTITERTICKNSTRITVTAPKLGRVCKFGFALYTIEYEPRRFDQHAMGAATTTAPTPKPEDRATRP